MSEVSPLNVYEELVELSPVELGEIILSLVQDKDEPRVLDPRPEYDHVYSDEEYEKRWQDFHGWRNFFVEAFDQTKDQDYQGRTVKGPLHKGINEILGVTSVVLESIHPNLTSEALMPLNYQSFEVKEFLASLNYDAWLAVGDLKREKRKAIDDFIDERLPYLKQQELPTGVLDTPEFLWQYSPVDCVGASFRMIFEDITGENVNTRGLFKATVNAFSTEIIHDEDYLKVFQSDAYKECFGDMVSSVSFIGADLEMIERTVEGIRKIAPDYNVYCMISLLSRTTETTNKEGVWHSNVLLHVDEESVVVHDPAFRGQGGEAIKLAKDEFYHRWGQAYFRGHLVVAPKLED